MDIVQLVEDQRSFFRTGKTLPVSYRLDQLRHLKLTMKKWEPKLLEALKADLCKSKFEGYTTELGMVYEELDTAIRHEKRWAKPRRVHLSVLHFPGHGQILSEPYGVALIIAPWNYPVQLTLNPLISAIAAGNCAVVKPSAYAAHVSHTLAQMLEDAFPPHYVAVVEGGRQENSALLEQKFDTIFFTGSVAVGKAVMEAASRNLTPVTLELGGKSPVIVDATANLQVAARRILWGKTVNSGQTCVAPDYVLVDRWVKDKLLEAMKTEIKNLWGSSAIDNPEYPCIINEKHFQRLLSLMRDEHAFIGGKFDPATRKIEPTVLDEVTFDSPVMQEEIFGPILPVIACDTLDNAIAEIVSHPKPLALYLFTSDKATVQRVLNTVSFGGGCVNDTLMHLVSTKMPFGGVGDSGMGHYHGKYGFKTFSHTKSVVHKGVKPDVALRYPPYKGKLKIAKMFMK